VEYIAHTVISSLKTLFYPPVSGCS